MKLTGQQIKLKELAEVNKALQITQTGTLHANNLLDQRDMILNDIAQFVDINIEENAKNGSVTLYKTPSFFMVFA